MEGKQTRKEEGRGQFEEWGNFWEAQLDGALKWRFCVTRTFGGTWQRTEGQEGRMRLG